MSEIDAARVRKLRARAWHFLSRETAQSVGLSLSDMQGFVAGSFRPTPEQLRRLERRMGFEKGYSR